MIELLCGFTLPAWRRSWFIHAQVGCSKQRVAVLFCLLGVHLGGRIIWRLR